MRIYIPKEVVNEELRITFQPHTLILKPYEEKHAALLAQSMSHLHVARHVRLDASVSEESELEWIREQWKSKNKTTWGIFPVVDGKELDPIATTSLDGTWPVESGYLGYNMQWWRKGIASVAHIARTGYAFTNTNTSVVRSYVDEFNYGSWKALEKMGYVMWGFNPSTVKRTSRDIVQFMKNYIVVHPDKYIWDDHWRGRDKDGSLPEFLSFQLALARKKTEFVLDLFEEYVSFI